MIFASQKNIFFMVKIYLFYSVILLVFSGCMNVNKSDNKVHSPSVVEKISGKTEKVNVEETLENSLEDEIIPGLQAVEVGSYFQATGNEPFWSLEIKNTGIVFSTLDTIYPEFKAPFRYPESASDTNDKFYDIETEEGNLQVNIAKQKCEDTMANTIYAYSVEIGLKRGGEDFFSLFNGCGAYYIDPEINGTWTLENIGDRIIDSNNFEIEIPHIVINTFSNTFQGFAGCNHIQGKLFYDLELIQFTDIISSKKICSQANTEDLFLEALNQTSSYNVSNNTLLLKNPSRNLMTFKKQGHN